MALSSRSLATIEQFKSYLDISDNDKDSLLETFVESASSTMIEYLGYDPHSQTYTDEVYTGDGTTRLYLRAIPITALTAVKQEDTAVDAATLAAMVIHDSYIEGKTYCFYTGYPDNYKITYVAGYSPTTAVGANVLAVMAIICCKIGALLYKEHGRTGILGVTAQSFDVGSKTYYETDLQNILRDLDSYVRSSV